ncbi:flagellar hook-length control protein FliK [Roseibium aggregatum]|uniref:Flagellar hook-length control protein FliK n=1 Tax=Roseibium aggregatum TaxID=187304 RepID=A0A939EBX8_9HYPH|nr:flagellar hook-length control protein FliK [Roseibium aggregatum]MBN9669754.1 flagellar hook-length control protein FliK [Roseibium aggregatum]
MVETVNAQPLLQGLAGKGAGPGLEPGTELKAKVEANLPGGVVRLASGQASLDLRVPAPLPVGAEVSVTVSGSKQQPTIQIAIGEQAEQSVRQTAQTPALSAARPSAEAVATSAQAVQPGGQGGLAHSSPALAHLVQPRSGSALPAGQGGGAPVHTVQSATNPQGSSNAGGTGQGSPGQTPGALQRPAPAPEQGTARPPGYLPPGAAERSAGPSRQAVAGAAPAATQAVGSQRVTTAANVPRTGALGAGQSVPGAPATAPQAAGQATVPPAATGAPAPAGSSPAQTLSVPGAGTGPAGQTTAVPPAGSPAVTSAGPGTPVAGPVAAPASLPTAAPSQSGQTPLGVRPGQPAAVQPQGNASHAAEGEPGRPPEPLAQGQGTTGQPPNTAQSRPLPSAQNNAVSQAGAQSASVSSQGRAIPAQPYAPATGSSLASSATGASAATPPNAAPQSPPQQAAALLRQPLAEQQSGLGSLFTQVGTLMSAQTGGKVNLPDPVVKTMQQILGLRLNAGAPLSGDTLKDAVLQSGQFREAQIAGQGVRAPTAGDLKSVLLSFKALLRNLGADGEVARPAHQPAIPARTGSPQGQAQQAGSGFWAGSVPENLQSLARETDAALARLRLTQLANAGLSGDEGVKTAMRPMDLVVELPLALGQETAVLQMQIGRDGSNRNDEEDAVPAWRLRFALDLTATGPLEAAVSLRGGGTYASLWIERKETFDNLNGVRETMEAAFADAGLDLQELRLIRGLPPKAAARHGALVDRQS